uniref:Tc1-like transposase DDE domain-containing protein n=1 Tax=Oncorhynchus tshawytscha TaxID=74940 RepID=A0A8C8JCM6_ONCTS
MLQSSQDLRLGRRFTENAVVASGQILNVLEWPRQSPDLNPIVHLWRDLKIAVLQCYPSNLTELERICREEWEKLPKYKCAKLGKYPKTLEAVIGAKGASTSTE